MEPEKSNLLRIRENQRRSRARRKDHVQELETKLRRCELQGVEASSEIQLAARRVADENKRLRKLLAQYGIAHACIESSREEVSNQQEQLQSELEGEAVQVLEALLVARKCCTNQTPSSNTEGRYNEDEGVNGSAVSIAEAGQPHGDILCPSLFLPTTALQSHGESSTEPNIGTIQSTNNLEREYGPRQDNHDLFPSVPQVSSMAENSAPFVANSCIFAADMITTMAGGDPLTVREELGCSSNMDCEVDNAVVFNVMGRYTDVARV